MIGALWSYETYTGAFRLARIDKEITLLERLTILSTDDRISKDLALGSIYAGLRARLAESGRTVDSPLALPSGARKGSTAAVAWLVLAILTFLSGRSNPQRNQFTGATAAGMLIFAIPFVVLAVFLPTFERIWINDLVYPIGHVVLVVGFILLWQKWRVRWRGPA